MNVTRNELFLDGKCVLNCIDIVFLHHQDERARIRE